MDASLPNVVVSNTIDKFLTVRELSFDYNFSMFKFEARQNTNDICLIYCVWANEQYFKFLYLSLVSNFKFTDATDYDIIIFVQAKLYHTALKYLHGAPVKIISVDEPFNKYSILSHPSLQVYSKIVISDCDTFISGKSMPLYKLLSLNDSSFLMLKDPCKETMRILQHRSVLSSCRNTDEYLKKIAAFCGKSVEGLTELATSHQWYLSCFICIDRSIITDQWYAHAQQFMSIKSWCDETVFLTYAWINNIQVKGCHELEGVNVVLAREFDFRAEDNGSLNITHPLHGTFCHDLKLQKYYRRLLEYPTVPVNNG